MATPDTFPENPHLISFGNDQLGVRAEVTLAHPTMETLSPEDRGLLGKLFRTEAYALAMALHVREEMSDADWRNAIINMIDGHHEGIFELEGNLPQRFLAKILGIDIEMPPYEEGLHVVTKTA